MVVAALQEPSIVTLPLTSHAPLVLVPVLPVLVSVALKAAVMTSLALARALARAMVQSELVLVLVLVLALVLVAVVLMATTVTQRRVQCPLSRTPPAVLPQAVMALHPAHPLAVFASAARLRPPRCLQSPHLGHASPPRHHLHHTPR